MSRSPTPMHIPDGFLSMPVAIVLWVIAAAFVSLALYRSRRQLGERTVPVMGVLAAFIFAAQALNFPVAGGTSGHLVGATLAAILLGPWPSVLVMTCVLIVQGLLFQDGGLLAMGGNIVNMAILSALVGATLYRGGRALLAPLTGQRAGRLAAAFFASWVAVVVSAMAASLELAASGAAPLSLALPAMTGVHMLIGLGEGLITAGALAFIQKVRPDLAGARQGGTGSAAVAAGGLVLALVVALFSPLASRSPDGLNAVAGRLGFASRVQGPLFRIFPKYTLPVAAGPAASTMLAVALGAVVVFALAIALGMAAGRREGAGEAAAGGAAE